MILRSIGLVALFVASCGGTAPRGEASVPPAASVTAGATIAARPEAPPPSEPSPSQPGPSEIFAKVRRDLVACYEQGRAEVPTMTSGRITFLASVDASGQTTCVVPSDDTGLTQGVENCMRARLQRERFAPTGEGWSTALPVLVRDASVSLGEARTTAPTIETVESHGLEEDVYPVVVALLPELYGCVRGIEKSGALRVLYVGGRVGADGRVACAVASSASPISREVRECASNVLLGAKFRAPKRGDGLVSVPLKVLSRR